MALQVPAGARMVLATHNAHKVAELRAILAPLIPDFREEMLISAAGLGVPEPVEDGWNFTANALIKARAVMEATGLPAVADDSGITVDIMGGAPGIFSARWAGRHGDDRANLELLLAQLSDVPGANRQGSFVCAAVCVSPQGVERSALGELPGTILSVARGKGGFGYDPIFQPNGFDCSLAELSPEVKNCISHRFLAFRQLAPVLATIIQLDGNFSAADTVS